MATIVPRARQLEYQDWEYGMFLHFGLRTFYEGWRDMDPRPMDPANFNPSSLDCDQWAAVAAAVGMKYMVMTAKHHCGFANWPSATTDFSVAASPWKDGRGDVVGEYLAACRKHGLAAGLYYSPYDHTAPVYDDAKAYDDYFVTQISELLEPYGPIDILWFDGCGSEGHEYDWRRIIGEVRRMQPNILIFNMGDPDFRWVGNEAGFAPRPVWNVVSKVPFSIKSEAGDPLAVPMWLPAECDARVRFRNWFYSDQDEATVKSVAELVGMYDMSVGRGCNLILNVGPDRRGMLPDADVAALQGLAEANRQRFANPLCGLDNCQQDGLQWTWRPAEPALLDHAVIQEDLSGGEHVRRWTLSIKSAHGGQPIVLHEGLNLGHKQIVTFPAVAAREVYFEITESDGEPAMRSLAYYAPVA